MNINNSIQIIKIIENHLNGIDVNFTEIEDETNFLIQDIKKIYVKMMIII